jgi:hypothetical protein
MNPFAIAIYVFSKLASSQSTGLLATGFKSAKSARALLSKKSFCLAGIMMPKLLWIEILTSSARP